MSTPKRIKYKGQEYRLVESNSFVGVLKPNTPYMVRSNDGVILKYQGDDIHPYIWRNPKNTSVDDAIKQIDDRCEWGMFKWFYNNTQHDSTKELIRKFIITNYLYTYNTDDISGLLQMPFDIKENDCLPFASNEEDIQTKRHAVRNREFENLNNATNQEFLRMRVGDMYHDSVNGDSAYFRVSSNGYDWFPIIRDIVDNHNNIKFITITPDPQAFEGRQDKGIVPYKIDGEPCSLMPREDFIMASNRNVVESKEQKSNILSNLGKGLSIKESVEYGNSQYILDTYNRLKRDRWNGFLNGKDDIRDM